MLRLMGSLGAGMLLALAANAHPGGHGVLEPVHVDHVASYSEWSSAWVALGILGSVVLLAGARHGRFRAGPALGLVLLLCLAAGVTACAQRPSKPKGPKPEALEHFAAFRDQLELDWDGNHLLVGSNGFPAHPMMVGITNWQQQVPLPQPYRGGNAWRIPIEPRKAAKPLSTRANLMRGAIAVAVNGVPIFNALNNRGEDAFLIGELDEFGGHCGKGDDYHYHVAPLHLEKVVGKGKPIAYALDGYPIMGVTDAEGKVPDNLDDCHGRLDTDGQYRYYASRQYPYTIGAMRGVVRVRGDGIEPQPKDSPARPPGRPLRGARITGFERDEDAKTYTLRYTLQGAEHQIRYTLQGEKSVDFTFKDPSGKSVRESYRRR